jgi:hypothetical protein
LLVSIEHIVYIVKMVGRAIFAPFPPNSLPPEVQGKRGDDGSARTEDRMARRRWTTGARKCVVAGCTRFVAPGRAVCGEHLPTREGQAATAAERAERLRRTRVRAIEEGDDIGESSGVGVNDRGDVDRGWEPGSIDGKLSQG